MLFYKNYTVYYNVYCYRCGVFTEKYVCIPNLIGCCVSELCGHLCPYPNVRPEAVYCCFTRTILFTKFWYVYIIVFMDFYQFTKFRLLIQSGF